MLNRNSSFNALPLFNAKLIIITEYSFLIGSVLSVLVNCATLSHRLQRQNFVVISRPRTDHKSLHSMLKTLVYACLLVTAVKTSGPEGQFYQEDYSTGLITQQPVGEGGPRVSFMDPQDTVEGTGFDPLTQGQVQAMDLSTVSRPVQRQPQVGGGRGTLIGGPSQGQTSITSAQYNPQGGFPQHAPSSQFGRGRDELTGSFDRLSLNPHPTDRRRSFHGGTGTQPLSRLPPQRRTSLSTRVPSSYHSTDIRSSTYDQSQTYRQPVSQTSLYSGQAPPGDNIRSTKYDLPRSEGSRRVSLVSINPSLGGQRVGPPSRRGSSRPGATFTHDLSGQTFVPSPDDRCPYGHGSGSGGVYKKSPFAGEPQQLYPQDYVAGHPQPLVQGGSGYPQSYILPRDPIDRKSTGPFSAPKSAQSDSGLIVSRYNKIEEIDLGTWVKVPYTPQKNILGDKQFVGDSREPYMIELYDPHWTGAKFAVVNNLRNVLETRPSITKNYRKPDGFGQIQTENRDSGYGRGMVDPGSHLFAIHVLDPSRSIPKDPVVYLRISRLTSEKIMKDKYLLVLRHFDARDWKSVASVFNVKELAVIRRRDVEDVNRAIRRSTKNKDDIVLIGEGDGRKTRGDDYAYLDTGSGRAETHGAKMCLMLFEL